MNKNLRFLIIGILIFVFAGLVIFSVIKIRYDVEGVKKNEFYITERSTTHDIQYDLDGKLLNNRSTSKDKALPCPT
jgi:hypothetical protein